MHREQNIKIKSLSIILLLQVLYKMPMMTISTMVHILLLVNISPVECFTQSDYYPYYAAKYKKETVVRDPGIPNLGK